MKRNHDQMSLAKEYCKCIGVSFEQISDYELSIIFTPLHTSVVPVYMYPCKEITSTIDKIICRNNYVESLLMED